MRAFIPVGWTLLSLSKLPLAFSAPNANGWDILWYDYMTAYYSDQSSAFYQWSAIETTGTPNEGTNEKQYYTSNKENLYINSVPPSSPACCDNDTMHLIPQKKDNKWTSARVESKKAIACPDGKLLRLEASIRVPAASADKQAGIWPAFWAMGESYKKGTQWPMCGEWDIMETADGNGWNVGTLHAGVNNEDHSFPTTAGADRRKQFTTGAFHEWALELDRRPSNWKEQSFSWFLDDEKWQVVKGSDVNDESLWKQLTQQAYFVVLNVAVGNNLWARNDPNSQTATGDDAAMLVKYVIFKTLI